MLDASLSSIVKLRLASTILILTPQKEKNKQIESIVFYVNVSANLNRSPHRRKVHPSGKFYFKISPIII